jgi:Flp pilus assembly protein TadG
MNSFINRPERQSNRHAANRFRQVRKDESGAEMVEFALVAPMVFLLIFGLIYGLLTLAAQVSLSHAASVGVRFATIPTIVAIDTYPSSAAVAQKVMDSTPFFEPGDCITTVPESGNPNEAFAMTVACDFPNPMGRAFNGIRGLFGEGGSAGDTNLTLTANVQGRRE